MTAEESSLVAAHGARASSWKPYPAYRDSGVEWLGKVPEHWDVKELKHFSLNEKYSFVDGPFGSDLKHEEYTTSGVPLIQLNNIGIGQHLVQNLKFISKEKAEQLNKHKIFPNDIVIAKMADPVARAAKVKTDFEEYVIVADCIKLRPNLKIIYADYLVFTMNTGYVRAQAEVLSTGTTRIRIGLTDAKRLKVTMPPLQEQRAISLYLDDRTRKIDSLIKKKQKMIELLKEERAAVINQAVTKGLDPDAQMKDSGIEWLGEVPEKWELRKISRSFSLIGSGATPESGNKKYYENGVIPWMNTGDLNDGILESCEKKITREAFENYTALKIYPKGTILIAMYGATIGKVGLLNFEACTNQACCALGKSSFFIEKFVFYWFLANKRNIVNLSFGGGQPNISQEIIKSLKLTCPPTEEQQSIVQIIESELAIIDDTLSRIEKEILLLHEYRTALISEVVTGKIDVREAI